MATIYRLLPLQEYTGPYEGAPFAVGDRTNWIFTLRAANVFGSGTITVVIEASASGSSTSWRQVTAFTTVVAAGEAEKTTPTDFAVAPYRDVYLRARVTAVTGKVEAELTAEAAFLDVTSEQQLALVSKELREYSEHPRIIRQAEEEVIGELIYDFGSGAMDYNMMDPGASDALRLEIALQAMHIFQRELLQKSGDAAAIVSLRSMPRRAEGMWTRLRRYRIGRSTIWFGR